MYNKLQMLNMKKMKDFFASLCVVIGLSSCNLNITPDTDIAGPDAGKLAYVEGLVAGIYNSMATIQAYDVVRYPDYQTDLFNETTQSGNRGGSFARWQLYYDDQDVYAIWATYYSVIASVNFTLDKANDALVAEPDNKDAINALKGELYFFRAYFLHQLALRFCEDYDPAKAETQLGVPCPTKYDALAKLNRGTLAATYKRITDDIKEAEKLVLAAGAANSGKITADAVTALKAQVALQMHDYTNASTYAKSLYTTYTLATEKDEVDDMWKHDTSTETIFQINLTKSTMSLVGSETYDYTYGSWDETEKSYIFDPAYIPEQWVCDLYDESDWRYGTYIGPNRTKNIEATAAEQVKVVLKFTGNEDLFSKENVLTYKNMPKIFRIAEMYMIDAEAQYRTGGDALSPLNALRAARGLATVSSTGDELFADIKKECVREFIGEGHRLFDLKRWGDGFKRDGQNSYKTYLQGGTTIYEMEVSAGESKFVWPIPQKEGANNSNIGKQNPGYTEF